MKIIFAMLLLAFSLISTIEVIEVVYMYESKIALQNQILNDAKQKNLMMINSMDVYMSGRTVDMLNLVHDKSIIQAILSSNTEFGKMNNPRQYIEEQNVTWMSVSRSTITPLMNSIIENPTADRLREMITMEKSLYHNDVFGRLLIANSYGADVAGSVKPDDYDQLTDTWYVSAKQNGVYIDDITYDKASNHVSISISTRVDDENGNLIGVAKGVIIINTIINTISTQLQAGEIHPHEISIINNQGRVLYSTDDSVKPFAYVHPTDFMQNIKNQAGYFQYLDPRENSTKYFTYASSSSSKITPTANWILIVEYDPEQLVSPIHQMTNTMILVMLAIIPIVFVGVFLFAHVIEKPFAFINQAMYEFTKNIPIHTDPTSTHEIKKLAGMIEEIQDGTSINSKKNKTEIKPHGVDELKTLVEHFNNMIETVSNSHEIIGKSEERFRMIFELSPDAIILSDECYVIRSVNRKFSEMFGYSHDEIVGKLGSIIVPEKTMREYQEFQSESTNEVFSKKIWLAKKDNTEFPCVISAQKIYSQDNKLLGNVAVIKDIMDLEKSNEILEKEKIKLGKSESLYRGLFNISPDPIRISTLDRITIGVNQSFLKKFGYTMDEIIGKPIYENIDEKSRADIENAFDTLRKGENVENMETTYRKKDGTNIPVLVSVSHFYDQIGNPIGNIAVIKDISEIHEARNRIQEKEEKILNQYLKIKQIEEQKDQFSSMISHELTTPLFPIKFQAEMLKDPKILGKLNKEQTNSINEIYQNAVQLERLISDILDAQKLEMNGMRFIKTNFELKSFMNQMADNGKNIIENKVIEFKNSTKDQITLISDPDRLTQVFSNLIKNSSDFVPENIGRIEINAEIQENDVLFYVKDNGIGIPKNLQNNLFKKFYQIDTSLKRKHRGSGLGLSICKGIVEGLGGKIWLESAEGLGTIVYFTIPKGGVISDRN